MKTPLLAVTALSTSFIALILGLALYGELVVRPQKEIQWYRSQHIRTLNELERLENTGQQMWSNFGAEYYEHKRKLIREGYCDDQYRKYGRCKIL